MLRRCFLLFVILSFPIWAEAQSIGQWRDHNSFVSVNHVQVSPDRIFAASGSAIFYYDVEDYSLHELTRTSGLSDVGIGTMAYDVHTNSLVVAYTNSNIDIICNDRTYNISDIKRSAISGDKQIYNIHFADRKAYLATGFGIVVLDLVRHEIAETYYLGENGNYEPVYDIAITDTLLLAAVEQGLRLAPRGSNRLHIATTWVLDTLSALAYKPVRFLQSDGNNYLAAYYDTDAQMARLACCINGVMGTFSTPGQILSLQKSCSRYILTLDAGVYLFNLSGTQIGSQNSWGDYGTAVNDASVDAEGTLWTGHPWAGLLRLRKGGTVVNLHPVCPANADYVYSLTAFGDKLYLCPGGKKTTYENLYLNASLHQYSQGKWQMLDMDGLSLSDLLNVAVDPTDSKHLSATVWGSGVLDFYDGKVRNHYNSANVSALTPYVEGGFSHLRTAGLAYDLEGNLWITNSLVDNGLVERRKDGTWKSFNTAVIVQGEEIDKILCDSLTGFKWFMGRANRIYVHDGESKLAYVSPNYGSKLETHTVTCMAQDHSGNLWFGTDKGLKVIYDGRRAFANGGRGEQAPVTCSNVLITDDEGNPEYLMAYESVTCIAVDGANRKWVGTAHAGIYLLSESGQEQLLHFTSANSPLASDKIATLAVHPQTGVLYVGTDKGVQAYRGTATEPDNRFVEQIHAYPNPVRPGYDGPIAIKGFVRNALVHITDISGQVVYTTTANGGQAVWDGRTLDGNLVASGTYLVFASDANGQMRSVAKVLIIR